MGKLTRHWGGRSLPCGFWPIACCPGCPVLLQAAKEMEIGPGAKDPAREAFIRVRTIASHIVHDSTSVAWWLRACQQLCGILECFPSELGVASLPVLPVLSVRVAAPANQGVASEPVSSWASCA